MTKAKLRASASVTDLYQRWYEAYEGLAGSPWRIETKAEGRLRFAYKYLLEKTLGWLSEHRSELTNCKDQTYQTRVEKGHFVYEYKCFIRTPHLIYLIHILSPITSPWYILSSLPSNHL